MTNILLRFSKRERALFIFTTSIILIACLYIFLAEPVYKKWVRLDNEVYTANGKLLKNLKLLANKDLLERDYATYKDYIQESGGQQEEGPSVLKEIEGTALSAGVKITSIKPKGTKELKVYKTFNVELSAEAGLTQFLKFIYDLEGSKKLLKVERLVLSLKGRQSDILKGTFLIRKISFR